MLTNVGVGFGRWSHEQPQGTPDKVPLTNVAFVNSKPVPRSALHSGYIINSTGVELGLTEHNIRGFSQVKLQLTPDSPVQNNWQAVPVSLAVDLSHLNLGIALFDTGIHQSYLRLDKETTSQLHTTTIIDKGRRYTVPTDDSVVHMLIGDAPDYIAYYNVTVGDTKNVLRPYHGQYRLEKPSLPAFINTGRFFYRGFDTMLDAQNGWFGLRWKGEPNDPNGGQYPATSIPQNANQDAWPQYEV